jgi:hypothetical protein
VGGTAGRPHLFIHARHCSLRTRRHVAYELDPRLDCWRLLLHNPHCMRHACPISRPCSTYRNPEGKVGPELADTVASDSAANRQWTAIIESRFLHTGLAQPLVPSSGCVPS